MMTLPDAASRAAWCSEIREALKLIGLPADSFSHVDVTLHGCVHFAADRQFLTGSRAYGTPRKDSDYDIVVRASKEDATALLSHGFFYAYLDEQSISMKNIRSQNLIICLNDEIYRAWHDAREACLKEKPVTRERAKELSKGIHDIPEDWDS